MKKRPFALTKQTSSRQRCWVFALCAVAWMGCCRYEMILRHLECLSVEREPSSNSTLFDPSSASDRQIKKKDSRSDIKEKSSSGLVSKTASRAVFYNIFIPPTEQGQANAVRIVKEQLGQVAESFAATTNMMDQQPAPSNVLYYTIGAANVVTNETMSADADGLCPAPLQCHHIEHYSQGSEEVTLDALRLFCVERPRSSIVVTYLHSKGSFHALPRNERWRRILTDAALSEECYSHMSADDCNLCGAQFHAIWTYFVPGNMWTVTCDYAAQLAPLEAFETTLVQVVQRFLLMRLRNQLTDRLFQPERKDRFGLERYASEHWVGSHPDIRPCDCSDKRTVVPSPKLDFAKAPRDYDPPIDKNEQLFPQLMNDPHARRQEYFVFAGQLMKWYALYGRAPGNSSWVWTHHPDGQFWFEKVQQYGENAVDSFVGASQSTPSQSQDALFAPSSNVGYQVFMTAVGASQYAEAVKDPNSAIVFYDIYIPPTLSSTLAQDESRLAEQQLIVGTARRGEPNRSNTVVFYQTMGYGKLEATFSPCERAEGMICHRLAHFDDRYGGELMTQVHEFCRQNPLRIITYIHNRPQDGLDQASPEQKQSLLKSLTKAAMSS